MEPQSESGKVIIIIMMGGENHKLRNIEKEREQVTVIFINPGNHCYIKGNSLVLPLWASRPSIQPSIHSFNIYWVIPTATPAPKQYASCYQGLCMEKAFVPSRVNVDI